ncbi:hypothetical protein ACFU8Q_25895 [Streptomyces sp. NPDC057543]|uniref:hypothetical protein n=1 Tax=Streptomyces sp. NPDC057543 TaxID=3346163 RepID=UPI0036915D73
MNGDAPYPPDRTDDELARLDVTVLLRHGLTAEPGTRRTALFGDGAAAVILDRLGTEPRSLAFLADTVRAGGLAHAAELPEPLPRERRPSWYGSGCEPAPNSWAGSPPTTPRPPGCAPSRPLSN